VTALSLRKLGYLVLEAGDGVEALKVWEEHHHQIALLITDMMMPKSLTGLDLAKRFRNEKGSLKVILCSGYSAELESLPSTTAQEFDFLAKPYILSALAKAVRRGLDKAEASGPDLR
jgi:two-component system cell cycle sensor histidine kinase/response regulator CckA